MLFLIYLYIHMHFLIGEKPKDRKNNWAGGSCYLSSQQLICDSRSVLLPPCCRQPAKLIVVSNKGGFFFQVINCLYHLFCLIRFT